MEANRFADGRFSILPYRCLEILLINSRHTYDEKLTSKSRSKDEPCGGSATKWLMCLIFAIGKTFIGDCQSWKFKVQQAAPRVLAISVPVLSTSRKPLKHLRVVRTAANSRGRLFGQMLVDGRSVGRTKAESTACAAIVWGPYISLVGFPIVGLQELEIRLWNE